MKRFALVAVLLLMISSALTWSSVGATGVTAEAVGSANLRSLPSIEGELIGEIRNGTRYPVIGRSEFFPWVLLGRLDGLGPMGWVFDDLVTIQGDLNVVPFSEQEVIPGQMSEPPPPSSDTDGEPTATLLPDVVVTSANTPTPESGVAATPTAEPTQIPGIVGTALGSINVRYGPGVGFQPLYRASTGEMFEVIGYHTQFPWVQIRFEDSPNDAAWISIDLLDIQGDLFSTRPISTTNFSDLPTLTPTPAMRASFNPVTGAEVPISEEFAALGDQLWDYIMSRNFLLGTERFGALYIGDLQTGEAISYGSEYAFSGTSINKIAILMAYFGVLDGTPTLADARDIANTMICSENVATNRLLAVVGGGDDLRGAEETTRFLRELGLRNTFITAPYHTTTERSTSTPMPRPAEIPRTEANQEASNPNPTNQLTVDEMGWLLTNIYECAYNETGPLLDLSPDSMFSFTPQDCRKMLYIMSENTVDGMMKAGMPDDMVVSHKHGWLFETHTNAGVFFTPNRDLVMVMALHQPGFLIFGEDSLPTFAHTSMRAYNYYNPERALDEPREGFIPPVDQCNYGVNDPIVQNLASSDFLSRNEPGLSFSPDLSPDLALTPTLRPTWTPAPDEIGAGGADD